MPFDHKIKSNWGQYSKSSSCCKPKHLSLSLSWGWVWKHLHVHSLCLPNVQFQCYSCDIWTHTGTVCISGHVTFHGECTHTHIFKWKLFVYILISGAFGQGHGDGFDRVLPVNFKESWGTTDNGIDLLQNDNKTETVLCHWVKLFADGRFYSF